MRTLRVSSPGQVMGRLSDAYLSGGFVCAICALTLHYTGSGDPADPISAEYSRWNPLAVCFVWSALCVSVIASLLYWRISQRAESLLMAFSAVCIGLIALTNHSTALHQVALGLTLLAVTAVSVIHSMRGDIGFLSIGLISTNVTATSVLTMLSIAPDSPFGLGYAERIWFVVVYASNALILDVAGIDSVSGN